jgi:hypothetical protein
MFKMALTCTAGIAQPPTIVPALVATPSVAHQQAKAYLASLQRSSYRAAVAWSLLAVDPVQSLATLPSGRAQA